MSLYQDSASSSSNVSTSTASSSKHTPSETDMVQLGENMQQDQDDAMTMMANTLTQLQAQLAALQTRVAQPTNIIGMLEEQFSNFLDNVENHQQHQFQPGVNPVMSARAGANILYKDYPPPPGTCDIKGVKQPKCFSGAQLDARLFI
ncbi:hypothetical protein BDM02DRAFT_3191339 [Thelephora ganbajun]|uniref:Uncharacterized protein n=1 Tax=Thelephora ganbajun TaxID=370292 RepID=A0ACB6Z1T4_THEGA|nr:hypothetical protein BDM02DRAFT_3191339 [Thelephora ganbajun]